MRRYYERNPVFVDPAFAAQPRGRFSGAASVAGRASVGGRARSSYAASVGGSYAAARGGFYAQSAAGAGPSSEVARLREQVLRSQAMTMQAEVRWSSEVQRGAGGRGVRPRRSGCVCDLVTYHLRNYNALFGNAAMSHAADGW